MSDKPTQTGVRGLLAKFENNISTSPPSRGRSPIGADGSGTVRPLSKVRASFIPVERNGGSGSPLGWLRSTDSGVSPVNTKPMHEFGGPIERSTPLSPTGSIHRAFPAKSNPPTPMTEKRESTGGANTTTRDVPGEVIQGLGAILKGSAFEDSKLQLQKNGSPPRGLSSAVPEPNKTVVPEPKTHSPPKETLQPTKPNAPDTKTTSSRPANIVIPKEPNRKVSKSTLPKGPKTPPAPRTPKLPATPDSHINKTNAVNSPAVAREVNKTHSRVNTPRRSGRSSSSPVTQDKRALSTREIVSRPGSKQASPNHPKIRPKSPTRPVRLPSSMTAPTASSAAKTNSTSSRPPSRNGVNANKLTRKVSSLRMDRSTAAPKTSVPSTTVRKQVSHASLAPPPNLGLDRPKSRTSNVSARAPDESFLARMMRPTASSANKVHDKIDVKSPPRPSRTTQTGRKVSDQNHTSSRKPPKAKSPEAERHEVKSPVATSPEAKLHAQTAAKEGLTGEDVTSQQPQEPESNVEITEPPVPYEPEVSVVEETPAAPAAEIKEPEALQA
ncbi:hypothetical protein D8B26_004333 [Coccidioides posadasii str. Silveira]|uniref:Mucin-7 n=1 Tax=Coccidioides posadasii (strain C735) TaxID=222929 RepID=C5PJ87_COCP7|nr:hypothetical protein CPC735_020640 [Coccidioides posadasii C735 delta SOWgp]EER23036.1 hypothetical protein CPC735_020640 [Coccidioides posadasii C735 delta SOWgp]QVM09676.1 hypothetical protein D8B26_004333 [Coccidioides posadasii str. Silveira]|eukprot:XP_003065181.1 hypothetical protein CPC735_020640 [Coccidioides posadasii C735 delta SOWgp]